MSGVRIICETCGAPIEAKAEIEARDFLLGRIAALLHDPDLMIEDYRDGWMEEVNQFLRDAGFKGMYEK